MRVAIQGFKGSYHAIAALKYFNTAPEFVMCESFPMLFRAMKEEKADYSVMAIENSVAGTILPNYALLRNSGLSIIGEIYLRIEHCLLALKGQKLADITEVRSHPMAILQCQKFFQANPTMKVVEDIDTALIAEQIKNGNLRGVAAIASEYAGSVFDMDILVKGIEDSKRNFTRFLVLRDTEKHPEELISEPDKASVCFHISNQSGKLSEVLNVFAKYGINLTKIQSSPVVGSEWEYFMHIDIEFDNIQHYKQSITDLLPLTLEFKVLGEYKRGSKEK